MDEYRKAVVQFTQQIMLMSIVAMFAMLSILAVGLAYERQLERDARINQERFASYDLR